jgi:hypothetical protein
VRKLSLQSRQRSEDRWVLSCVVAACLLSATAGCGGSRLPAPVADAEAASSLREVLNSDTAAAGTEDTAVCTAEGRKLFDQSLQVDESTGGLANVVVFARKVSRVIDRQTPADPLVFDQKACEFLSPVFAAQVGQPIDVRNSDPIGHNTNISGTSFNQLIPAGDGTLFTPSRETGMPTMVTCNIHPWMKAYAVFREDGYVTVSAADGTFTIQDLPAGEKIELQVWHERSSGPNGALAADMPDYDWSSKGRFTVMLDADQVTDLGDIQIPASALAN